MEATPGTLRDGAAPAWFGVYLFPLESQYGNTRKKQTSSKSRHGPVAPPFFAGRRQWNDGHSCHGRPFRPSARGCSRAGSTPANREERGGRTVAPFAVAGSAQSGRGRDRRFRGGSGCRSSVRPGGPQGCLGGTPDLSRVRNFCHAQALGGPGQTGRQRTSSRTDRGDSEETGHRRDRGGDSAVDGCLQGRSEEHTSELQSRQYLVCRLLLET